MAAIQLNPFFHSRLLQQSYFSLHWNLTDLSCTGRGRIACRLHQSRHRRRRLRLSPVTAKAGDVSANSSAVIPAVQESTDPQSRNASLRSSMAELDRLLQDGQEEAALTLLKQLAGLPLSSPATDSSEGRAAGEAVDPPPLLLGFGRASLLPKRAYSAADLRLQKIDASKLLSPQDSTLAGIRQAFQLALLAGLVVLAVGEHLQQAQVLALVAALLFLGTADQVASGGAAEALAVDSLGNWISAKYRSRVALHEAGHFLVAYLVGLPPKGFTLSGADALRRYGALNVQAGTTFLDIEFQQQVQTGKLRSDMVDAVATVALAGVVAEYLAFGLAEGGLSDIAQLDSLFRALKFTQKKSDEIVRRAVLDATTLLRRHSDLHKKLADAMRENMSVGSCICLIEEQLLSCEIV